MFATILGWLGNLLGGPFAKAAVDAYRAKLDTENSKDAHTADLVARELAVQEAEARAHGQLKIAEIGHWYEPEKIAAYIVILYLAKVMIWDAALHLGATDSVRGDVGEWAGMIMLFYFGKRGIENVARIIKR